jgi:hypothetical protein
MYRYVYHGVEFLWILDDRSPMRDEKVLDRHAERDVEREGDPQTSSAGSPGRT